MIAQPCARSRGGVKRSRNPDAAWGHDCLGPPRTGHDRAAPVGSSDRGFFRCAFVQCTHERLRCRILVLTAATALVLTAGAGACSGWKKLAEYDFRDRTLGVTATTPPRPEVFRGTPMDVYEPDLVSSVIRLGSEIALAVETGELKEKLDSAFVLVDVADRIASQTLERSATYMRARPVDDPTTADFLLEVDTRAYGIQAELDDPFSFTNPGVYYLIDAELLLFDGETGREIWKSEVSERDPVTTRMVDLGPAGSRILTAATFADLSVDEIARALEGLADYAADRMARKLREDLTRALDERAKREGGEAPGG